MSLEVSNIINYFGGCGICIDLNIMELFMILDSHDSSCLAVNACSITYHGPPAAYVNLLAASFTVSSVAVPGTATILLSNNMVALEGNTTELLSLSPAVLQPPSLGSNRIQLGGLGLFDSAHLTIRDDDGVYYTYIVGTEFPFLSLSLCCSCYSGVHTARGELSGGYSLGHSETQCQP